MKLVKLSPQEFDDFSQQHPYTSFQQHSSWALVKEEVGWKKLLLGYRDDQNELVAAGLFLGKKLPIIQKYLYYCPHGYLIDFHNHSLWSSFQKDLELYLKKEKAFHLILDPYVPYQKRDIQGEIVPDGFCHQSIVDQFLMMNFTHTGFVVGFDNLQPRFHFRLPLENSYEELEKNFKYETKRRIHKKDYLAIHVRELQESEIPEYKKLMEMTAQRRGFHDRPLFYYQNMYRHLHPAGILRYMGAEIDFVACLKNVEKDIQEIEKRILQWQEKDQNSPKTKNRIHEEEIVLQKALSLKERIQKAQQEKGDNSLLSVVCLLSYGKEAVMLLAGNDEDYLQDFNTSNIIVAELIKLAIQEGYHYYNFYGIAGDFRPESEFYGLYSYKKQYGGEVCEYIGQFEKVLDPLTYHLYQMAYKAYRLLRKK